MKKLIILFTILSLNVFYAQKGINLINDKSKDTLFLKENHRIKIETISGKQIVGKFTITNDSVITIKEKQIALIDIVAIRKQSTFSAIICPIAIGAGTVFMTVGVLGVIINAYNSSALAVLIPIGLPLYILPFTRDEHKSTKWNYKIRNE